MGLFVKRPEVTENRLYSIGLNKTVLIIGLGNSGREYEATRHNIGFSCLDSFVKSNDFPEWIAKKDLKCELSQATLGEARVIAMKPTTMMNLSGDAVGAVTNFYKIPANLIVVVHDELDINFGQIRTRIGGSDAGHNGIKSIISQVGEDFGRIRIGIGPKDPPQIDSADFVLQKFNDKEQSDIPSLWREASAIISEYVYGGFVLPSETRSFLL